MSCAFATELANWNKACSSFLHQLGINKARAPIFEHHPATTPRRCKASGVPMAPF